MTTENKNQLTLYRFVSLRSPELSKKENQEKRFVFHLDNRTGVFFDAINNKPSRRVWAYASQYFHLQNQCKVKSILVKEFKADFKNSKGIRDITGYIYNFNEIEKYFKKNPKNLPEYEIGQCKYDKLSPTQINAIPAVHNVEYCKTNK